MTRLLMHYVCSRDSKLPLQSSVPSVDQQVSGSEAEVQSMLPRRCNRPTSHKLVMRCVVGGLSWSLPEAMRDYRLTRPLRMRAALASNLTIPSS